MNMVGRRLNVKQDDNHINNTLISKSKKSGKDQETILSSATSDTGYHMGKQQKYNDQEVCPLPLGDHKAAMNRRESVRNKRHTQKKNLNEPQKKYPHGTVIKNILLECLNWYHGANLTLSSDVDQDT